MPLPSPRWLAFAALLLAHAPLTAQQRSASDPASALAALCPGAHIHVSLSPAGLTNGVCRFASADSLLLARGAVEERFALQDVDTVWVRGRGTKTGAVAGGLAGATALTALGFAFVYGLCGGGCWDDYPRVLLLGVTVGGSGGALVGAALGALTIQWRRRYPE